MKQLQEEFLAQITNNERSSKNTIEAYRRDLTHFFEYLEKQELHSFDRFNETLLNSYLLHMERIGYSPATITRNIVTIKKFITFLVNKNILEMDAIKQIVSPEVERNVPKTLSVEEMELFLSQPDTNTIIGMRDKAMLELLYATGMKVSELISLCISDLNQEYNIVTCSGARKSRILPYGTQAHQALELYLEVARPVILCEAESNVLFLNHTGSIFTRQGIHKIIKNYAKNCNLSQVTPNVIRNSFAAHLISNGAQVNAVGEMLGYRNVSMAHIYASTKQVKIREEYQKAHPRV